MSEVTAPGNTVTRQCSCGKKDGDIDTCVVCVEYRSKLIPQHDSFILGAIKLHIVEAYFNQQYYHDSHGSGHHYGGQGRELISKLWESQEFKDFFKQMEDLIISRKEEWYKLAENHMIPLVENKGRDMVKSWDLGDSMRTALYQSALEHAKKVFAEDEGLKQKIKEAAGAGDYTVKMHVTVEIIQKKEV